MRKLINYIRSCFCKHEWELISHDVASAPVYSWMTKAHRWTHMCRKCGYIKTYTDNSYNK